MKCGCVRYISPEGSIKKDDDDCLFPEAVAVIKLLLHDSAWQGTKANREAEAFLAKVHD